MIKATTLGLLLSLASFSGCTSSPREDEETAAVQEEMAKVCPENPDKLTERILATSKDAEKVRNAAKRMENSLRHQDYHLYNALGDADQANKILADIYVRDGVACPRLTGTPELRRQRQQLLIDILFMRSSSLDFAVRNLKREEMIPTTDMYIKRGDYWIQGDDSLKLFKAFEAYEAAGHRAGVQQVLSAMEAEISSDKGYFWLHLAIDASLYLGNQSAAQHYAAESFIRDPWEDASLGYRDIQRTGLLSTTGLYQRRGEFQLTQGNYLSAFKAFQAGRNEPGIQKVIDAITAPISAERQ